MSKSHKIILIFLIVVTCLAIGLYYFLLTAQLAPGQADLAPFKGVVLNDSLMYDGTLWIAIKVNNLDVNSTVDWLRRYPTLLPMTLTTYLLQSIGISGVIFNMLLLAGIPPLILAIAKRNQLGFPAFALSFVFLNSSTIYFSQSYTKEILLLLLFVLLFYGLSARKSVFILLPLLGIGLVRIYALPPILGYLSFRVIRKKWPNFPLIRALGGLLIFLSIGAPFVLVDSAVVRAARIMLENLNATSGISYQYLKSIQYPLLPLLFLPIKVLQNLFEPLLNLRAAISSNAIHIGHLMAMGGALMHLVFAATIVVNWRKCLNLRFPEINHELAQALIFILGASIIMYSLIPYVQMRYLYPLAPGFGLLLDVFRSQAKTLEKPSWHEESSV